MQIPEGVLEEAAARFDLDPSRLRYLGGMDGAVFETERDGSPYVLKLEPVTPDRLQPVREKFDFIAYLGDNGVRVARPLPSHQDSLVEIVAARQGLYAVTQAAKAPGHHVGAENSQEWTPSFFRSWGSVMGRMHRLARDYPYWRRSPAAPTGLDLDTTLQDWQMEHASFARSCPDGAVRQRWLELGEKLKNFPVEREAFGLIHNDLHPWNFLVDGSSLTVIDFDVCCYHWFITDIAIAVYHACWGEMAERPHNLRAFACDFLDIFMSGYLWEYDLDRSWFERLPDLIRYREMLLFTALSNTWTEPLKDWQARMIEQLRRQILAEGQSLSILFE